MISADIYDTCTASLAEQREWFWLECQEDAMYDAMNTNSQGVFEERSADVLIADAMIELAQAYLNR